MDYRGNFSLSMIGIVDPNQVFTYIRILEGSQADSTMYKTSIAKKEIDAGHGHGGAYFGDLGFTQSQNLVTMFEKDTPDQQKQKFNSLFTSMRAGIEMGFGLLKRKFPILRYGFSSHDLTTQQEIMTSLVILHNMQQKENMQKVEYKYGITSVSTEQIKRYEGVLSKLDLASPTPRDDIFVKIFQPEDDAPRRKKSKKSSDGEHKALFRKRTPC